MIKELNILYKCSGCNMDGGSKVFATYIMKLDDKHYDIFTSGADDKLHIFYNTILDNLGDSLESTSLWREFYNFKIFKPNNKNLTKLLFEKELVIYA